MGREALADHQGAEGFRVPIIKEPSVNFTAEAGRRGPDFYNGLHALGETIHRAATPTVDRVLALLGRERSREMREVSHQDSEAMNLALVEANVDAALEGVDQLEHDAAALGHRVESRDDIIATLERQEWN